MEYNAIAVCLFGMESTVAYELKNMGFEVESVTDGRIYFKSDAQGIIKANLSLRCAERVLVKLGKCRARSFAELFDGVYAMDFADYIPKDAAFPIAKAKSINSQLHSIPDIQSICKKAVVEKLRKEHSVQELPETGSVHPIHVFLKKDEAELSIDTTGPALHKRGYRERSSEAPLRESMAAFLVMLTPWNKDRILVDPMCGSGTIPIEAAMIGANIMPGVTRNFSGEELSFLPKSLWKTMRKEALEAERRDVTMRIYASDIDPDCIDLAKENAEIAGVAEYIQFEVKDMRSVQSEEEYGFLITNPPYGERLSNKREVKELEVDLAKMTRKLKNWSIYVITSDEQFEKNFGRKATKTRKLYNGMIKTNYYQFPGPKPGRKA